MMKVVRFFTLITVLLFMAACGGGGGGSTGPGSGNGKISLSSSELNFIIEENGLLPSEQSIAVSFSGDDIIGIGVAVADQQNVPDWLQFEFRNTAESPVELKVSVVSSDLTVNQYSADYIVGVANRDGDVLARQSLKVNLTVIEKQILQPSVSALAFTGVEGQAAVEQSFSLQSSFQGNPVITPSFGYSDSRYGNWLQSRNEQNQVFVSASDAARNLPVGTHTARIYYKYEALNGVVRQFFIDVSYTVSKAIQAPGELSFVINRDTPLSEYTKTIEITTARTDAINWQAVADVPWLQLSPASGNLQGNTQFDITVVESEVKKLFSARYQGVVSLSSTSEHVSAVDISVQLDTQWPQIDTAAPPFAFANQTGRLTLKGLNIPAAEVSYVKFNQSNAVAINVVSDSEIEVDYDALPAGSYSVSVGSVNEAFLSRAELTVNESLVTDAASNSYGFSTYQLYELMYQPVNQTLYIVSKRGNAIETFFYRYGVSPIPPNNMEWRLRREIIGNLQPYEFSLSQSGRQLFATQSPYIMRFDEEWVRVPGKDILYAAGANFINLDYANDGSMVLLNRQNSGEYFNVIRYNTFDDTFVAIADQNGADYQVTGVDSGTIVSARYGNRAVIAWQNTDLSNAPLHYYDAALGRIVDSGLSMAVQHISVDADATHVILNQGVYDENFQLLGQLPAQTHASLLSYSGHRAYTVEKTDASHYRVRVFDLQSDDGAGGFLPIGSPIAIADAMGDNVKLEITPDETLLFAADNTAVRVVPLP